jgi:preprotein translocase subunit SecG
MVELLTKPVTILHIVACLFLVLVVLLQPGKSGGMGAFTGAAATQVFGGRGAGTILTKITWVTATIFFLTSLTLAYLSGAPGDSLAGRAGKAKATQPADPAK